MKKSLFPAIALFLGICSVYLFFDLLNTYNTLSDNEPSEAQQAPIMTDPTTLGRIVNVKMETTMGEISLEIYPDKAPDTVKNFLYYTNAGAYDSTIFHRIIPGFMNQGGGYSANYKKTKTQRPISNEAFNGLKNQRGTIAMARNTAPHSATNQFFINTADNIMLNYKSKSMSGWGYAVFGKVSTGMDVIDAMAAVPTGSAAHFSKDVPQKQILILKMSVVKSDNQTETTEASSIE